MSDEVPDPADDFEDMDLDNLDYGLSDDDLDDVIEDVKEDEFLCAGQRCRLRKTEVDAKDDDALTQSRQKFWVAGVEVNWPEDVMQRAAQFFDADIMLLDDGWVEVRVGHERTTSREEAEDEAEWLAEQAVMLENDPNAPV